MEMMDWPIFLKTKDLPAFSGLSMERIRDVLSRSGVQPVDLGGRHYGLKWYRDAVMEALRTLHAEAQQAASSRRPPKRRFRIVGKSTADLYEELRRGA